jgi:ribonuclease BN (tRNA processing enzyme)
MQRIISTKDKRAVIVYSRYRSRRQTPGSTSYTVQDNVVAPVNYYQGIYVTGGTDSFNTDFQLGETTSYLVSSYAEMDGMRVPYNGADIYSSSAIGFNGTAASTVVYNWMPLYLEYVKKFNAISDAKFSVPITYTQYKDCGVIIYKLHKKLDDYGVEFFNVSHDVRIYTTLSATTNATMVNIAEFLAQAVINVQTGDIVATNSN